MSESRNEGSEKRKAAQKPLSNSELSAFCGQLALIIGAGLSAQDGIDIMYDDAKAEELGATGLLHLALEKAGVFPSYMIHMVETGERTGRLDEVMHTLETHYDRQDEIHKSIYQAVVYPVVLSIMVLVVILILLAQVMPVFERIFSELGTQMTGFPLVLTKIGNALSGTGFVVMIVLLALAVAALIMGRTEKGAEKLRKITSGFPGIRQTRYAESACHFAGHMALTLASGLTTEEGLDMAEDMIDDEEFRTKLKACRSLMDEGTPFAKALSESGIFSGIYAQIVAAGAKTGNMDAAMTRVSDLYMDELDKTIVTRLSRLEPTLIVVLAVIVGGILLSVMLPLLNIMATI
jgi:type IV pilus assembly protein PilC